MHADVVLLGCARKRERVPLPVTHLWAIQEHVLPSPGRRLLLFDLNLAHLVGMEDNLGDEGPVPSPDFASDPLEDVNQSTDEPVLPENSNLVGRAEWRPVRL